MNKVIQLLIISSAVFDGAQGLLAPIFALFVEDFIIGSNAKIVGLAVGVYFFTRSLSQLLTGYVIDKIRGEKDDFWLMFAFSISGGLIFLLYLIVKTPVQLYLVQFLLGLCDAFSFPSYYAIFSRHLDKEKEGREWGLNQTTSDFANAGLAALGGYLAVAFGYKTVILTVSGLVLASALILLPLRRFLLKR